MFCYALSQSDRSEWRQRISAEAEHFIDVSAMASDAIAQLICDAQIQILVNLNGYTKVSNCQVYFVRTTTNIDSDRIFSAADACSMQTCFFALWRCINIHDMISLV